MTGVRLHRRAPQLLPVVLAPLREELGDLAIFLVRLRRGEVATVLRLEGLLDLGIVEQILPIEVDLDEGLHRHAEDVVVLVVLEIVDEGGEVVDVEVRRGELRRVLQRLGDIDQEIRAPDSCR